MFFLNLTAWSKRSAPSRSTWRSLITLWCSATLPSWQSKSSLAILAGFHARFLTLSTFSWMYNDIYKLAIKAERHVDYRVQVVSIGRKGTSNRRSVSQASKATSQKSYPKQDAVATSSHLSSFNSNPQWSYKCQGLEHVAFECPNKRVVTLLEETPDEEGLETTSPR